MKFKIELDRNETTMIKKLCIVANQGNVISDTGYSDSDVHNVSFTEESDGNSYIIMNVKSDYVTELLDIAIDCMGLIKPVFNMINDRLSRFNAKWKVKRNQYQDLVNEGFVYMVTFKNKENATLYRTFDELTESLLRNNGEYFEYVTKIENIVESVDETAKILYNILVTNAEKK